jgi:hypothetical protein
MSKVVYSSALINAKTNQNTQQHGNDLKTKENYETKPGIKRSFRKTGNENMCSERLDTSHSTCSTRPYKTNDFILIQEKISARLYDMIPESCMNQISYLQRLLQRLLFCTIG